MPQHLRSPAYERGAALFRTFRLTRSRHFEDDAPVSAPRGRDRRDTTNQVAWLGAPSGKGNDVFGVFTRGGSSLTGKIVLSIAMVMVAASLVGIGAFAVFTDTQSVSQATSSGTVTLAGISTNGANNRLSIGASNIAAGDTIQRAVDVKNTGNITLASVTLTTTATTSSLLNTDTTNGLQMVIDKCSVAWTETGGPPYTYTCGGTTSSVLASTPVIGSNLTLSNLTLTASTDNFLRVTLTLPSAAPNTLQNQSSVIQYSFTATQRAAAAQ
jgi:spore coat-associated protein N